MERGVAVVGLRCLQWILRSLCSCQHSINSNSYGRRGWRGGAPGWRSLRMLLPPSACWLSGAQFVALPMRTQFAQSMQHILSSCAFLATDAMYGGGYCSPTIVHITFYNKTCSIRAHRAHADNAHIANPTVLQGAWCFCYKRSMALLIQPHAQYMSSMVLTLQPITAPSNTHWAAAVSPAAHNPKQTHTLFPASAAAHLLPARW
jgi:hypothetical protein